MSQSIYHSSVSLHPCMTRPSSKVRRTHRGAVRHSFTSSSPNYRLRRIIAAAMMALSVAIVMVLLAGSGGRPASASRAEPANSSSVYVALPGDSLWSIASDVRGAIAIDTYVDALIDLNGGTSVQVGQAVRLP